MKRPGDRDIRHLEHFGTVTALLLTVLCVLYLMDFWREPLAMELILALGFILHLDLALLQVLHRRYSGAIVAATVACACVGVLIYVTVHA
jgi:hypothetical protein